MRVTKYEHATLTVHDAGKTLVIDPGSFTAPLGELEQVVGVVITHEHPDHWTPEHLTRILRTFPDAVVYGPAGVVAAASDFDVVEVAPGDTREVGPFRLTFFGGRHALIHESIPVVDNVGVLVNDAFYYPGDSYTVPGGVEVKLLAAPVGAPWLKIGDAMDFVLKVAPRQAFGTHDMTLSVAGRQMGRARLAWAVEQDGGEFLELEVGEAADI
ncbi:MBL fold metallo-hydrolase [Microbacterium sp. ARD31]|jgi:L-ascorbate metabolism protein UlaG (beta-lactamase superfamily)|uniref:MBL fold metallo-hydrolase n=1 Tax=Microbacterium sp. ARD31 TaxID=2962576 RepID=UPI002882A1D7|nr:MBL fold metallo-hydrolase [Microbacterium sp. ARD31]MDT0186348.1 MBL fold metallo-hydrolase [Microbacterium sp. ARD31]